MEAYKDLMKKNNSHQLLISIILVCYIMFNIQTPHFLAKIIDNIYGNIVVIMLALFILTKYNPILGVITLFVAYELIRRSSDATGTSAIKRYLPTQMKKDKHFSAFNQFPITLEEEVVKKMVPLVESSGPSHLDYNPVFDDSHDAMKVSDTM